MRVETVATDQGEARLAGGASIAAVGMIYQQIVAFGSGLLIARVLGAADYGVVNIARNLVGMTAVVTTLGLDLGLQRYLGSALTDSELKSRYSVMHRARYVAWGVSLLPVVAIAIGLGTALETRVYPFPGFARVMIGSALALPFMTDLAILGGAYRGVGRLTPAILAETFLLPTMRLMIIVGLFLVGWRVWAVIAGSTGATVLVAAYLANRGRRDFAAPRRFDGVATETRDLIRFGVVLAASVAATMLTRSVDLLTLGHYAPAAAVGQYAIMQLMLLLIGLFGMAFGQGLGAMIAARHAAGDTDGMARLLATNIRWLALLAAPLFAVFVFWGANIGLIFGSSYTLDPRVMFWLAATSLATALFHSVGFSLSMTGRHVMELRVLLGGLALSTVLCLALVPPFGQMGAALATFASVLSVNLWRIALVRRSVGIFPLRRDLMAIVLASVALAAVVHSAIVPLGASKPVATACGLILFGLSYPGLAWYLLLRPGERLGVLEWTRQRLARTSTRP